MKNEIDLLLEFNRNYLQSLAKTRKDHLDTWFEKIKEEEEVAAQLFYTHLLGKSSDKLAGFTRHLIHKSGFSGDLVLAKKSPDGRIFCMLADATGHGLSAALTLMPAATQFRSRVEAGTELFELVININHQLNELLPGDRFIAAIFLELDLKKETAHIWNGGMPPLFLLDQNAQLLEAFHAQNLALGVLKVNEFKPCFKEIHLPSSGQFFAASDGLFEIHNAKGEAFGTERLLQSLCKHVDQPLDESLLSEIKHFSGKRPEDLEDDLSIMHLDLDHLYQVQKRLENYSNHISSLNHPRSSIYESVNAGKKSFNCWYS